jgi:thiol:disulfide interchange protein DsbD
METVKTAFGFVILALPVFLLERITGDVGHSPVGDARRSVLLLGIYRQSGGQKSVDAPGANLLLAAW